MKKLLTKSMKIFGVATFVGVFALNVMMYLNNGSDSNGLTFSIAKAFAEVPPDGGGGGPVEPGGGGMGCYTTTVLDCPLIVGGQYLHCNFTGVYGPPYNCDPTYCLGVSDPPSRRCVQATP